MARRRQRYGFRRRRRRTYRRRRIPLRSFRAYTGARPRDFVPRRLKSSAQFDIVVPPGAGWSSTIAFPCFASQLMDNVGQANVLRITPQRRGDPIIMSLQHIAARDPANPQRGLDPTTNVFPNIIFESDFDELRRQYDSFKIAGARCNMVVYSSQGGGDANTPYVIHGFSEAKHEVKGTLWISGGGTGDLDRVAGVSETDSRVNVDTILGASGLRTVRRTNNQQGRIWLSQRPQGLLEKIDYVDTDFNQIDCRSLFATPTAQVYPFSQQGPSFNPIFYFCIELPYIRNAEVRFRAHVEIETVCFFKGSKPGTLIRPLPNIFVGPGDDFLFTDLPDYEYQPLPEEEGGRVQLGEAVAASYTTLRIPPDADLSVFSQSAAVKPPSDPEFYKPTLSQASIDKLAEQVANKILDGTMNCQGPSSAPS